MHGGSQGPVRESNYFIVHGDFGGECTVWTRTLSYFVSHALKSRLYISLRTIRLVLREGCVPQGFIIINIQIVRPVGKHIIFLGRPRLDHPMRLPLAPLHPPRTEV
jgi:hypothetical protein